MLLAKAASDACYSFRNSFSLLRGSYHIAKCPWGQLSGVCSYNGINATMRAALVTPSYPIIDLPKVLSLNTVTLNIRTST